MKFSTLKLSLALGAFFGATFVASAPIFAQFGPNYNYYPQYAQGSAPRQTARPQTKTAAYEGVEAVLFGVDDYRSAVADGERGSTLKNLTGCVNDVEATRAWLKSTGVQDASIQTLSDSAKAPTAANLLQALDSAAQKECGRLIVLVACHGMSYQGKSYVCPRDARPNVSAGAAPTLSGRDANAVAADAKARNLIAVDDIFKTLQNAKATEVLLILDACRDNRGESFMREFSDLAEKGKADAAFRKANGAGTFAVITSCSYGETAQETQDRAGNPRGAFSYHFLEGLSGRADELGCYDGKISLVEAYNYAYVRTSAAAKNNGGAKQTPEIFVASVGGNMTLAEEYVDDLENANYDDVAALSDLRFLTRAGRILCRNDYRPEIDNRAGRKALDYVLTYVPNNELALASRGSANRALGDYQAALDDMSVIGQKLQLHASQDAPNKSIKKGALLTVEAVDGDSLYLTEIDNKPLDEPIWIAQSDATWNAAWANGRLPETTLQAARHVPVNYAPTVGAGVGSPITGTGGVRPVPPIVVQ